MVGLLATSAGAGRGRRARGLPGEGLAVPQLPRDGRRDPGGRGGPPGHRRLSSRSARPPVAGAFGREGQRQRRHRRGRARGPVRRAPSRRRAPDGRAGAVPVQRARRRLRHRREGHETSSTAARSGSSSWSTRTAASSTSPATPTAGWRKNRQPTGELVESARTSTATTNTGGAAAAARPAARRRGTYRGWKPFSAPETQGDVATS